MQKESAKPLVRSAFGLPQERQPVWFLRQAGRYLPEYQAIRAQLSFIELCKNPQQAAEVTLQPLRRFDLDAAIIFSDILVPPMAMGQELSFDTGHGPHLAPPIRSAQDLLRLKTPDVEKELGFVGEALSLVKGKLAPEQALIGFAGAPCTVASYMIEGGATKTFSEVKKLAFTDPKTFEQLLDLLGEVTASYLEMQVRAGADVLMLFDSWAGSFSSLDYVGKIFPATAKLIRRVKQTGVPLIYYPGQGSDHLAFLQGCSADVVAVDWRVPLSRAARILREESGLQPALQGNLDPMVLSCADESFVRGRVREILDDAAKLKGQGFIFNVGHGLLPSTKIEAIQWAIDEVRRR